MAPARKPLPGTPLSWAWRSASIADPSRAALPGRAPRREEIVNDTCRLLNEGDKHEAVEQFTTWEEIAEHLSAEPGFLEKFKERMGYAATDGKVWIECKPLCLTIVGFIKQVGVVPPKSDIACYTPMDETFCDLDVRPSMLKTLGPKSDADLPDFGDDLFLKTTGKLVEQEHSAVKVELATDPGMPMDSDTPLAAGVTYNFWEALERLANLFRIYPDPGPLRENAEFEDGGSSLMQRSVQSRMRGMTPDQARLNVQKEEMAKAYMGLVIRAFSAKETQDHMKKWFGRDSFYNPMARKEVLRVMNSVDHMISNVHYVYPGAMCTERTFAYVYPKGGACEENQLEKYACRTLYSDRNRFIFYLCPFYFTRPLEMVETLVHEGSHHATAYTDDVEFQGSKAYGRRTCKELARKEPLQALKNADNFCYYIQDAAEAVQDHPGEQVSAKCPTMAKFKHNPTTTGIAIALKERNATSVDAWGALSPPVHGATYTARATSMLGASIALVRRLSPRRRCGAGIKADLTGTGPCRASQRANRREP